jgi:hypothetical protein
MDLRKELEGLDNELTSLLVEQARLAARIEGLQAERGALSGAMSIEPIDGGSRDPTLANLTKDRAIVAVLEWSDKPLRIQQIVELLNEAGRDEHYNIITVYLNTLLKQGRVRRVDRGLYVAAEDSLSMPVSRH